MGAMGSPLGTGGSSTTTVLTNGNTFQTGTNARVNKNVAISAGTASVSNTSVTANSLIRITLYGAQTNPGETFASAQTPGVGFTITSSNALHSGNCWYEIVEGV